MKYLKSFSTQDEYKAYKVVGQTPTLCGVQGDGSFATELVRPTPVPNDEIWYTSDNEEPVEPDLSNFEANLVSNTYTDGKAIIKFDAPITSIGEYAFSGCSGLTSVAIPNSVTSIGAGAFSECNALASVSISNSVTSIGEYAFSGCSGLVSIGIPNSVTSIGAGAFSFCSGLTSVAIPNSVTSIGESTFSECNALASVSIPNSVTSIEDHAFSECNALASVSIPNSVTSIWAGAFDGCSGLTSITSLNPTPPTLFGNYVFETTNDCPIYVPSASVDTYKAASGWSSYASRIQAIQP